MDVDVDPLDVRIRHATYARPISYRCCTCSGLVRSVVVVRVSCKYMTSLLETESAVVGIPLQLLAPKAESTPN